MFNELFSLEEAVPGAGSPRGPIEGIGQYCFFKTYRGIEW